MRNVFQADRPGESHRCAGDPFHGRGTGQFQIRHAEQALDLDLVGFMVASDKHRDGLFSRRIEQSFDQLGWIDLQESASLLRRFGNSAC